MTMRRILAASAATATTTAVLLAVAPAAEARWHSATETVKTGVVFGHEIVKASTKFKATRSCNSYVKRSVVRLSDASEFEGDAAEIGYTIFMGAGATKHPVKSGTAIARRDSSGDAVARIRHNLNTHTRRASIEFDITANVDKAPNRFIHMHYGLSVCQGR